LSWLQRAVDCCVEQNERIVNKHYNNNK
jgi:hypothetical protein